MDRPQDVSFPRRQNGSGVDDDGNGDSNGDNDNNDGFSDSKSVIELPIRRASAAMGGTITIAPRDLVLSGGAAPAEASAQPIVSIYDCDGHVRIRIRQDPHAALEGKRHFQHVSF